MLPLTSLIELIRPYYNSPPRAYHNWTHIQCCLFELDALNLPDDLALRVAILFHDAIYDPKASDNEQQSADLAKKILQSQNHTDDFIQTVQSLILDTTHQSPPSTQQGQFIVDIDLSILGKDLKTYAFYALAIQYEYSFVPPAQFVQGRSQFLQKLLARPRIYHTPHFHSRYESPARANIQNELSTLTR